MAQRVHELDERLIGKIAAGEVVERPASVVKELVENSLDAGATRVDVHVEGGGLRRIVVSDDGWGMSREDALLAIRRHTTSKIATEADLEAIQTLGFRGEALASIVEVSRTTLVTREAGAPEATRLDVEGGVVKRVRAEGRPRGTTVEVRDLFFNTPARRKFLKSERTEFAHVIRVLKRFALAHPSVHFTLTHGGGDGRRLVLESPPAQTPREVVAQLYGAELARALLDVHADAEQLRVRGLVAPPTVSRGDRGEQHVFVNGRFVRDAALQHAIAKAYEGFLPKDRHPVVFLFLEVDPRAVDVNVHPQKLEVRFRDPRLVQGTVKQAIVEALLTRGAAPTLTPRASSPACSRSRSRSRSRSSAPLRPRAPRGQEATLDLKRELLERRREHEREHGSEREQGTPPSPAYANAIPDAHAVAEGGTGAEAEAEAEVEARVVGQLHGTYIVVQTPEGFELIDQHVAHERVLFERYLEQLLRGGPRRQALLVPLTLEFPPDEAELLERHLERLKEKLGIELERFGPRAFLVRAWPEAFAEGLSPERARQTLERLLELLEREDGGEGEAALSLEELAKRVAADRACAAAVVKHTPLTPEEMAQLVRELYRTKNPYRCPHGRPIVVKYPLEELERAFGRR